MSVSCMKPYIIRKWENYIFWVTGMNSEGGSGENPLSRFFKITLHFFPELQKSFLSKNVWTQHCWVRFEKTEYDVSCLLKANCSTSQKWILLSFQCAFSISNDFIQRNFCHFESMIYFFFSTCNVEWNL